jgi:hypothetical protein
MSERRFPSERERAIHAISLGACLGVVLSLLARVSCRD